MKIKPDSMKQFDKPSNQNGLKGQRLSRFVEPARDIVPDDMNKPWLHQ